jgi:FMN-dependent dehydrogenase.
LRNLSDSIHEYPLMIRPFTHGLAHPGQAGVEHVLENTLSQLDLTVGPAGINNIDRAAMRDAASL